VIAPRALAAAAADPEQPLEPPAAAPGEQPPEQPPEPPQQPPEKTELRRLTQKTALTGTIRGHLPSPNNPDNPDGHRPTDNQDDQSRRPGAAPGA